MNILTESITIIQKTITYENLITLLFFPINIIVSIAYKIKSNLTLFFIFLPILYVIYNIFKTIKLKYDELNLFNVYLMSDEERKLYVFTQKLTSINQKFADNSIEIRVNKGKIIYIFMNFYKIVYVNS